MPNEGLELVRLIKIAAQQAINASVTCNVIKGIVTNTTPLEIQLENKIPIPAENIALTKNTCLWSVDMDVDHKTDDAAGGSGDAQYESHHHGYTGRKTFRVHNELAIGDEVILARCEGGQRYIALDKLYNSDRGCSD